MGFPVRLITKMLMSLSLSKVKTMLACFFFLFTFFGAVTNEFCIQIFEHLNGSVCVNDNQIMDCTS
jgi:hypothetical protein